MITKNFFSVCLLFLISFSIKAQESPKIENPPVIVEGLVGNRGLSFQFVSDKKFQSLPKLGYYFVANFQTEWGDPMIDDYMLQGHFTYTLIKGLDAEAGFIWNHFDGIRPSIGLIYTYFNPDWFILINPRTDIVKNPNTELFGIVEYRPKLTEKFNLFTKLQGVYVQTMGLDIHARSYIMLRAGLTVKEFSFGLASNIDFYGPNKDNTNNLGLFLLMRL